MSFTLFNHSKTARLWLLTAFLVVGAGLRILQMTQPDIWFDEGFTYYALKVPNLFDALLRDDHPPTYFALLKLWTTFAGQSELGLRYLSALLAMITLATMYPLAQEVSKHRPVAHKWAVPILAVFALMLLDMQQYIAQEARMYALYVWFASVSMWAFLRWQRLEKPYLLVIWMIFTALCVYTHYLGAWTGVTQGIFALLFLRGRKRFIAIGALVVSALLFVPWLLYAVVPYQLNKVSTQPIGTKSNWQTVILFIEVFLSKQWVLIGTLVLLGVVGVGAGNRWKWQLSKISVLLVLWVLVPFWLTYAFNFAVDILADHRLAQLDLPLALLIAYGLFNIPTPSRWFFVAVFFLYGVSNFDIYRPRQPWAEFGRDAGEFARVGEAMLIDVGGGDYQLEYYIDRFAPNGIEVRSIKRWQAWYPDTFWFEIRDYLHQFDTVWFARWSAFDLDPIANDLGFTKTSSRHSPDWEQNWYTYRYDRLPQTPPLAYFENGMTLVHQVVDAESLRVDLWWRTDRLLEREYTVSVFLLDEAGQLVAQYDSFPLVGEYSTTRWQVGETVFDPRPLQLKGEALPMGRYQVGVSVYWWQDGIQQVLSETGEPFVILDELVRP